MCRSWFDDKSTVFSCCIVSELKAPGAINAIPLCANEMNCKFGKRLSACGDRATISLLSRRRTRNVLRSCKMAFYSNKTYKNPTCNASNGTLVSLLWFNNNDSSEFRRLSACGTISSMWLKLRSRNDNAVIYKNAAGSHILVILLPDRFNADSRVPTPSSVPKTRRVRLLILLWLRSRSVRLNMPCRDVVGTCQTVFS